MPSKDTKKKEKKKSDKELPLATKSMVVSLDPCNKKGKRTEKEAATFVVPIGDISIKKRGMEITLKFDCDAISVEDLPSKRCHVFITATDSPVIKYAIDPTSLGYFGLRVYLFNAVVDSEKELIFKGKYHNLQENILLPLRPEVEESKRGDFGL